MGHRCKVICLCLVVFIATGAMCLTLCEELDPMEKIKRTAKRTLKNASSRAEDIAQDVMDSITKD